MKRQLLSIVIPAYNEEENIKKGALEKVARFTQDRPYLSEVIIVSDGSSDQTDSLTQKFIKSYPTFRLIKNPHQGKAATVITGVLAAMGDYILFSDMDQATPISEVEKFLPFLKEGYEVVIGSRRTKREGAPLIRKLMALSFNLIVQVIALPGISDSQCGFKSFQREAVQKIISRMKLFGAKAAEIQGSSVTAGFDVELLFLARKMKFKVKEVDVEWHHVGTGRVNPLKDSLRALRDVVKVRLNDLLGAYRN